MTNSQEVLLKVPAMPEFLRVARVAASGLASRLGFDLDEVDDLRLALDELCFALIGKGNENGELELVYKLETAVLTISGTTARVEQDQPELGELSRQILTALVDDHKLWHEGETVHFTLSKHQIAPGS